MKNSVSLRRVDFRSFVMALASVAIVGAASVLGAIATVPEISGWYAQLEKPAFTPPDWLFGPVWTTLYVLMAIAFWRVLTSERPRDLTRRAVCLFLLQISLNAGWSWAFFAAHSPLAGLVVIVALWIAIALTIFAFLRVDTAAGLLLTPYLVWVSFALVLNAEIARLSA